MLALLTVWGLVAVNFGDVLELFKVLAIVANPVLAIGAVQILLVNRRFLPKAMRPPLWRQAALVAAAVVYGSITLVVAYQQLSSWLAK